MQAYTVEYKMYDADQIKQVSFLAQNKADAYDKAVYEHIPQLHDGSLPYSAWVVSVTYNNGNYRVFNTGEGNPY